MKTFFLFAFLLSFCFATAQTSNDTLLIQAGQLLQKAPKHKLYAVGCYATAATVQIFKFSQIKNAPLAATKENIAPYNVLSILFVGLGLTNEVLFFVKVNKAGQKLEISGTKFTYKF